MEWRMKAPMLVISACVLALAGTSQGSLVAHWPLDETSGTVAEDAVGHDDGTLYGNPVWEPARVRPTGSLQFDGKDDYMTTRFVLDPAKGPFSAFLWVLGNEAGRVIIAQQDFGGTGQTWLVAGTTSGKLGTELTDARGQVRALYADAVVTDGRWHHVGVIWDGQYRRLYVDGEEVAADQTALADMRSCLGGLVIGGSKTQDRSTLWSGGMDDIRVYDHALSKTEIRVLAGLESERQVPPEIMVVAPKTIYTGASTSVTVTAMNPDHTPLVAPVTVLLGSTRVFEGTTDAAGRVVARFDTPDVAPGAYTLEVQIGGVKGSLTAQVQVRRMPIVLIETDKPIYKPGQTIQGRALVLTNELRPSVCDVTVQITDGKGVKISRKDLQTNAFGVAPFTLDLASELNYGTWKITAEAGSATGTVDVRVEEYVLPRFEVKLETERDYFLVTEQIPGTVRATYFFGKPVDGTVEIRASRYVGTWEEYTRYTAPLAAGTAEFSLPEVRYVSGTPGAGGSGSVQLDVTVTDTSGHQEKSTKLLKIVGSGVVHQLIAATPSFTPGLPFEVRLVAQTPDGTPLSVTADLTVEYYSQDGRSTGKEKQSLSFEGSAPVTLRAPRDATSAYLQSTAGSRGESGQAELFVYATYSPTDSFLHLSRSIDAPVNVGDTVSFDVFKTYDATIYYDVFANGHTVWSDAATGSQITFRATQQMVPAAKVVAYIINPNNEVSADTVEFKVVMDTAASLAVGFNAEQVLPGDRVQVSVIAGTEAMVGFSIVDESVYALNEGRLNMQAVFDELEKRFMDPQAEVHAQPYNYATREVFDDVGLQVVTSGDLQVPEGRQVLGGPGGVLVRRDGAKDGTTPTTPTQDTGALADVARIRQFFPETWLWTPDLHTDKNGAATIDLTAPDSITTWRLHAVSTSDNGLGIAESSIRVFQEFFGEPDLPYSVTRGEQFPVRIQIYNYLDQAQTVQVDLRTADWFKLLDIASQQVKVDANSVASASFLIEPTKLGSNALEVTLRSAQRADAVRKEVLVEPQGTKRELITNGLIRSGDSLRLDANMPANIVPDSGKLLLNITPSLVAQSMNGVDDLLQMPYGCGEQNMIFFAPDVEVLRYLDATSQLTPEVRAKAEHFITCGYQRELTFRHADGSFSAFGESDGQPGSLWLTAFVLDCFSGAREITTVDDTILAAAAQWIASKQKADGSWDPVGFVIHSDMTGGVQGNFTLSAFVTIALADYASAPAGVVQAAVKYLRDNLSKVQGDPYALAIAALAFAKAGDSTVDAALDNLLRVAKSDASGLHWEPYAVETTAYAALAMIEKQRPQANDAIKWLSLQRNSLGGYGNTQDTVMGLKALMTAARNQSRNVNLTVTVRSSRRETLTQFIINEANFDVLQTAELPLQQVIELEAQGTGEVRYQLVRRFNVLLSDQAVNKDMALEVKYDADHVEVDDIVNVTATVRYTGLKSSTGMMVVDIGVPTGFDTVQESLDALVTQGKVTKFDVAGRKVIFYLDGLTPREERSFTFQVKARFPVRAIIPDSKAYSYYEPDIRAEATGKEIAVGTLSPQGGSPK
jgi:CD109 antigen